MLYLIGRDVGPVAAQAVSKFFALQRHVDGLAPFIVFDPPREHGDAVVAAAQAWLDTNAAVVTPVREMIRQSGLSERGFSRRFQAATGHAPLDYVQRLRVEQAKRRLERTGERDRGDRLAGRLRGPLRLPPPLPAHRRRSARGSTAGSSPSRCSIDPRVGRGAPMARCGAADWLLSSDREGSLDRPAAAAV